MAINSKEDLIERLQLLRGSKGSTKDQLDRMTALLTDLVETTFSLMDQPRLKETEPSSLEPTSSFATESMYALETTSAPAVDGGLLTIPGVEFDPIDPAAQKGLVMQGDAGGTLFSILNQSAAGDVRVHSKGGMSFSTNGDAGVERFRIDAGGTVVANSLKVSENSATGGGILFGDDASATAVVGDIVSLNDGYCSLRFPNGVRVYSAQPGTGVSLRSDGAITCGPVTVRKAAPVGGVSSSVIRFSEAANHQGLIEHRETGGVASMVFSLSGNAPSINERFLWGTSPNQAFQAGMELTTAGRLTCKDDIVAFGSITSLSDARVKENVRPIESALDKVMRLDGVRYNRKDTPQAREEIGVVAQQVLQVVPEVVVYDQERDLHSVDYGRLSALLLEAVKEQQQSIQKLTDQLTQKN